MTEAESSRPADPERSGESESDSGSDESTEEPLSVAADTGSALAADAIELTYPTAEGAVVECERIDVPEGEITALVGPNGSGKSTLLKALANQLAPENGVVRLHGEDLTSFDSKEIARELGLLSQENESVSDTTVEELVAHGRYPHRGFLEGVTDEDREAIDRAIELTGIEELRTTELGQLSGGQKQLAWIALVLAQDTGVLLLDEPTTFLDLHHQFRVLETIRELNERRGVTVAVVLHDVSQAARFADNVIALDEGGLYDWGPPREIVTEELLADVFGVEATVGYDPELQILPKRSIPNAR